MWNNVVYKLVNHQENISFNMTGKKKPPILQDPCQWIEFPWDPHTPHIWGFPCEPIWNPCAGLNIDMAFTNHNTSSTHMSTKENLDHSPYQVINAFQQRSQDQISISSVHSTQLAGCIHKVLDRTP